MTTISQAAAQSAKAPRRREGLKTENFPLKTPLALIQRQVASLIMSPLTKADRMRTRQPGGANTTALVEDFIKPNDRLTSFERLEIYNRQYWFRLLDCLYEDYPGLCALLGQPRFHRLEALSILTNQTAASLQAPGVSPDGAQAAAPPAASRRCKDAAGEESENLSSTRNPAGH